MLALKGVGVITYHHLQVVRYTNIGVIFYIFSKSNGIGH